MNITWEVKKFSTLTPEELYAILQLRNEVFVVEQHCAYQDLDDKDQTCYHVMGWQHSKLIATSRLVPPGEIYDIPSIGRVVTSPSVRGTGTGRMLMEKNIEETRRLFGDLPIKIGAQLYLLKFYSSLGFAPVSDTYLEDGIEHIKMLLA
ncbi:MAG: GNAT family N-acetyltransferase [Chitinophagaceae bacterium]